MSNSNLSLDISSLTIFVSRDALTGDPYFQLQSEYAIQLRGTDLSSVLGSGRMSVTTEAASNLARQLIETVTREMHERVGIAQVLEDGDVL